ncbi:hypothetical protein HPB50_014578 [Hyalomma asiaticum]|uniref:Uncharacterized protein n=1 Tax=Hyalomma asiaticum TaxID=266040 RepID=A0ACB7RT65_HYAAI|nr:hypothetical protein HPB50_014578 [Hyalomma asiaticum]
MGPADELKLEIEALKLQLEVEKLKDCAISAECSTSTERDERVRQVCQRFKGCPCPMPADDTMIPAWFKMADSLLKMLEVPEEMQGALILPLLTEKVKPSVVSQSRSGTSSYGELKEKVLRELRLAPTEYRRCFLETKKEVRERSCDRTKLTGSFGKAVTTEVVRVPIGLPCPSGNTRRFSLPVTSELATGADLVLTPDDHESLHFALAESEHDLECGGGALVELPDGEGSVANGSTAVSATHICDDNAERQAIRVEPKEGSEVEECCRFNSELRIGTEDEGGSDVSELDQVGSGSDDLDEEFSAAVGAARDPPHVCSVGEDTASTFAKERRHGESLAGAHNAFDVALEAVASVPALGGSFSWSGKAIGHCPSREEDGYQRQIAVLGKGQSQAWEKESAAERGSFATVWTKETFGRWIFGRKKRALSASPGDVVTTVTMAAGLTPGADQSGIVGMSTGLPSQ